ncbi:tetratricopeptide repeat protein [soil metagenome]
MTLSDFDKLWDYPNPAASEAKFVALMPEAETSGDAAYLAELLTQIARAQGLQRRYEDTLATLARALPLLKPERVVPRIRYGLERGRVHNDQLQTADAKSRFVEAWELGLAHWGEPRVDNFAVDAAHMIAIVEPPAEAIRCGLLALDYAGRSDDPRARNWEGTLKNNLAWAYSDSGDYARAIALFEERRIALLAIGNAKRAREMEWSKARNLRLLGLVDESLAIQQSIYSELVRSGTADTDGYCNEELGECLLALGRADEARPHFARAYAALSRDPWFPPTFAARLERMRQLSTGV